MKHTYRRITQRALGALVALCLMLTPFGTVAEDASPTPVYHTQIVVQATVNVVDSSGMDDFFVKEQGAPILGDLDAEAVQTELKEKKALVLDSLKLMGDVEITKESAVMRPDGTSRDENDPDHIEEYQIYTVSYEVTLTPSADHAAAHFTDEALENTIELGGSGGYVLGDYSALNGAKLTSDDETAPELTLEAVYNAETNETTFTIDTSAVKPRIDATIDYSTGNCPLETYCMFSHADSDHTPPRDVYYNRYTVQVNLLFSVPKDTSYQIRTADITDVFFDYDPGDAPRASAKISGENAEKFEIEYEYWEQMEQTDKGPEPVAFWYSDESRYTAATPRLTAFEEGRTYIYSLSLKAKEGYAFADTVQLTLNGMFVNNDSVRVYGDNNAVCFAAAIQTIHPGPVIERVEVTDATLSFRAGDKPTFTGKTPDGALYTIGFEAWDGSNNTGWTSSDYWNRRYGDFEDSWGMPITTFLGGTTYSYRVAVTLTKEANAAGYHFSPDKTRLILNGQEIAPDLYDHDGIDWYEAWFSGIARFTPEGSAVAYGDVNGDGAIDTADAVLILQYAAKLIDGTALNAAAADVNGDGAIDTADAVLVLQYAAKLIAAFPRQV